jgi:flagellar basal body-associated protein FliL
METGGKKRLLFRIVMSIIVLSFIALISYFIWIMSFSISDASEEDILNFKHENKNYKVKAMMGNATTSCSIKLYEAKSDYLSLVNAYSVKFYPYEAEIVNLYSADSIFVLLKSEVLTDTLMISLEGK